MKEFLMNKIFLIMVGKKMDKIKLVFVMLIIIFSVFLFSCTPAEKECTVDDECVPATCCHPTDAVNKENGLDCSGRMCTSVCQPETIDCGQGEIKCISGECKAVIFK